jgi:hypothetical protein
VILAEPAARRPHDIMTDIPIALAILRQAAGTGFNLDQAEG